MIDDRLKKKKKRKEKKNLKNFGSATLSLKAFLTGFAKEHRRKADCFNIDMAIRLTDATDRRRKIDRRTRKEPYRMDGQT